MRRLLREPLLHFAVVGAVLFALAGAKDENAGPLADEIVVTAAKVEQLTASWIKARQQTPNAAELAGLVEDHIKDEVFYREAVAMRLDRDDLIVRRRMRQKLEFLSEDVTNFVEPSDDDLAKYLAEHPDVFRRGERSTFEHVFVRTEGEAEAGAQAKAKSLLEQLLAGGDGNQLGDRTGLPPSLTSASERDVIAQFGPEFALGLRDLKVGPWTGPVRSAFGLHLVRVSERIPGALPPLAEVRATVEREWRAKRRLATSQAFYQGLRARYTIRVETPGAPAPAGDK